MSSAAVIFDGDDTLWDTMSAYALAKHEFFGEMALIGFDPDEVECRFERIDMANVDRLGFKRERFPTSMVDTYRYFCDTYRASYSNAIEHKIRRLGDGVIFSEPKVDENAEDVLRSLQNHYTLILSTKGDEEVQRMKINGSELASYFQSIYIFERKTDQELEHVIQDNHLSRADSWVIGNSLRSDINPALRLGLRAIWIPRYTWDYEEAEFQISPRLVTVESLRDCQRILLSNKNSVVLSA
jgi:putative hydrolase of the HAD superfamily